MVKIIRNYGNTSVKTYNQDIGPNVWYAIAAYGFLLPYSGEFSPSDLADKIKITYGLDNIRNRSCYESLLAL